MINPFFLMKTFFRYIIEIRQYLLYGILLVSPQQSSTNPISVYDHQEHGVEIISNADNYTGNILCDSGFSSKPIDIKHLDEDEENVVHFSESDLQFDVNKNRPERFQRAVFAVKQYYVPPETNKYTNFFLDYVEEQIEMNNHEIFDLYDIYSIFDLLSTKKDFIKAFELKLKLHQMMLNRSEVQYLFRVFKPAMHNLNVYKDYFEYFYKKYLLINYFYEELTIDPNIENNKKYRLVCTHNGTEKRPPSSVFGIDEDDRLKKFNDDFILRFNEQFKLYWQKFFYLFNLELLRTKSNINLGNIQKLNLNTKTKHPVKHYCFFDFINLTVSIPSNAFDKKIRLRFNSVHFHRLISFTKIKNYLKREIEDFFKYENPQVEFRNLYRKNVNESDITITLYGENVLIRLSRFIGQVIADELIKAPRLNKNTFYDLNQMIEYINKVNSYEEIEDKEDKDYISIEILDWDFFYRCLTDMDDRCITYCEENIKLFVALIVSS
ncbi:hypothetical protein EDEG_02576 [Edhazardia aedis USNM 41457]|uniref:Uncharacterized protein n=1 Tax=Edhazardia aedis (strain USNM 41457) TaxID=1003232 RepID=J9DKA0_EDHAE|nr:hypothetical protein EDEG_02576 [Edhazardia aedis USNM 41457]|eukprot:EJW03035.1 hypothetical protein EDEG_02576 [Edhazardia aedis USNM 41457]